MSNLSFKMLVSRKLSKLLQLIMKDLFTLLADSCTCFNKHKLQYTQIFKGYTYQLCATLRKCMKWQEIKSGTERERERWRTDPKENTQEERLQCRSAAKDSRVKSRVWGLRAGKSPEWEIRRRQKEVSDLVHAGCLLFVRETVGRQSVLKWINYYSILT